ncbi:MAG TPA: hypothetical protein VKQ72_02840 [Aggregatilineales bacterium]|nr:hypothetical protein [Aggregatilineales bacterium]
MRTLIYLTGSVIILLTASIGGVNAFEQAQPVSDRLEMLHLTDCVVPCWIGIVPGKTRMNDALQRIKEVYGNTPGYTLSANLLRLRLDNDLTGLSIALLPDDFYQDNIVELITFDFQDITVGDLMSLCAFPRYISAWPTGGAGSIALVCNNYSLGIKIDEAESQVNRNLPSDGLILAGASDSARFWVKNYHAEAWHGFGAYPILELWSNFP